MPYGYRPRTAYRSTSYRRPSYARRPVTRSAAATTIARAYKKRRTTAKKQTFIKYGQRANRQSVVRFRPSVKQNAKLLSQLSMARYGPIQMQKSVLSAYTADDSAVTTTTIPFDVNESLLAFHLNDPNSVRSVDGGIITGPTLLTSANQPYEVTGGHCHFAAVAPLQFESSQAYRPGNDKLFMQSVKLDFKFDGGVNDMYGCDFRIQVIRQKKVTPDFYNPNTTTNFLPQSLSKFADLAGFTTNKVDRACFEVLAERRVSWRRENVAGPRYCSIYMKLNKPLKHLFSLSNQYVLDNGSPWVPECQHPLANMFVIINRNGPASATCDLSINRSLVWRDSVDEGAYVPPMVTPAPTTASADLTNRLVMVEHMLANQIAGSLSAPNSVQPTQGSGHSHGPAGNDTTLSGSHNHIIGSEDTVHEDGNPSTGQ